MKKKILSGLKLAFSIGQLRTGIILFVLLLLISIAAPILATHDPKKLNDDMLQPPSAQYLLGTDHLGRDMYSMLLYGASTSLQIGFTAALISGIIGTLVGGVSGYFGGKVDQIIVGIINLFYMTPTFFLILIIVALFGSSMLNVMIVIGLTSWPGNARLMRAQAISLRERTFVKSATAIGESQFAILFKHIIPNGIFPIVANTTMGVAGAILTEASLSFLGLGDPNIISWGQIINYGKGYLPGSWWIATFSGLATVFAVLTFFLIGDGLNRILSPKLHSNN